MNELHREADKFERQSDQLVALLDRTDEYSPPEHIEIALGLAKRVRRTSTLLVRELARINDRYSRGGTSE